jgi:hypothetical protein
MSVAKYQHVVCHYIKIVECTELNILGVERIVLLDFIRG